jgi:hypothetical protein
MRVHREVDHANRIVILRVSGPLDDAQLVDMVASLGGMRDAAHDFSLLIDLQNADGSRVTSAGVRALVAQPLVLAPESRRAVVVASDLGFGMARMYQMLRDDAGSAFEIFREFDAARRWAAGRRG